MLYVHHSSFGMTMTFWTFLCDAAHLYSGQKKKTNINPYPSLIRSLFHFYSNQDNHFSITSTIENMAEFTNSLDFHVTFSKVLLLFIIV